MRKIIIKIFGLLAIILMIGFSYNGKNAVADGGVNCDCALFRQGCFANGWGATCAPEGVSTCWLYHQNCKEVPE